MLRTFPSRISGEKISHFFRISEPCKKSQQGFTLIEVMVVVIILGILATIIVPRFMDEPEKAKRTKAALQLRSLESALKLYKLDNGVYPDTEQGLEALVKKPETGTLPKNWREGGYLERSKVPKDPWGNPFVYVMPGQHGDFDLSSYGKDGEKGGEGPNADINNWELE
ncbi:MAG: type II secretion system major pseudopilin GspG [Deltaproteobacteria bacterium]|nr:type II secretion system major pseudopilin GspG [Deltaproteobacteria bacterium]MBW2129855.1 type II secretion system major pseudopilin GspG [Deltaproteobacteria bacterium]MBW2304099.1 type II secretion system major pseudopilin GspG [Deltaproteobacteria bacterium]